MNIARWTLGFLLLAAGLQVAAATGRPNVVVIVTDDEDLHKLGCYGGAVRTPWIDSLAKNGVRFTNANVVHSVCSPSRYAILTGRYYDNNTGREYLESYPHGQPSCVNNFMVLEDDGMNLPSVLKANGYYTGFVGKFHLSNHDLLNSTEGWEAAGLQPYPMDADPRTNPKVNAKMQDNHDWWCQRVREKGFDWAGAIYPANLREGFNIFLNVHNVEWTTEAAVRFLKERKGGKQPFFISVNTTYPHGPAPESKSKGSYTYSLDADVQVTGEGYVTDRDLGAVLAGGETRKSCKRLGQEAELADAAPTSQWWDAAVGAIIEALKQNGQYDNTLLIYISDHGLKNQGKSSLYDGALHVPLLMQWPARVAGGWEYAHVVGSIDLAPTILEACGIEKPEGYTMDGVSLLPVLAGKNEPVREALFVQMGYAHGVKTDDWKYIAVRYPPQEEQMLLRGEKSPKWKSWNEDEPRDRPYLMLQPELSRKASVGNPHYFERNQLYHLKQDPEERNNLFAQMPEKAAQMQRLLHQAISEHIPHRPFGEFGPLGDSDAYGHLAKVVIDHPPKTAPRPEHSTANDRVLVKEPWCEASCPAILKIGEPFELTFSVSGLAPGLQVGLVLKAVGIKGKAEPIVARIPRIQAVENGKVYTRSVAVTEIPDGANGVQLGIVVSPTGSFEDRVHHVKSPTIEIVR